MIKKILNITLLLIILLLQSCIVVKYIEEQITAPATFKPSPKPSIPMSDKLVRPESGDMIAFLPKDWFFIDAEEGVNSDVFAVAVNSDYSLSAVFSEIRKNESLDKLFETEKLMGVAKYNLQRKIQRSSGLVGQVGKMEIIEIGLQKFLRYETSTTAGALRSYNLVFKTDNGNYFEFSLIPMDIIGKPIPTKDEFDKIFYSIVATLKY